MHNIIIEFYPNVTNALYILISYYNLTHENNRFQYCLVKYYRYLLIHIYLNYFHYRLRNYSNTFLWIHVNRNRYACCNNLVKIKLNMYGLII